MDENVKKKIWKIFWTFLEDVKQQCSGFLSVLKDSRRYLKDFWNISEILFWRRGYKGEGRGEGWVGVGGERREKMRGDERRGEERRGEEICFFCIYLSI